MKQQYLLIEDVEDVGRSGELISAKPGFEIGRAHV